MQHCNIALELQIENKMAGDVIQFHSRLIFSVSVQVL